MGFFACFHTWDSSADHSATVFDIKGHLVHHDQPPTEEAEIHLGGQPVVLCEGPGVWLRGRPQGSPHSVLYLTMPGAEASCPLFSTSSGEMPCEFSMSPPVFSALVVVEVDPLHSYRHSMGALPNNTLLRGSRPSREAHQRPATRLAVEVLPG